jgi:peptide/nickel transport system ATP-binding protein
MERVADIENLHVRFVDRERVVFAVRGVSLHVAPGETLALVGESGCGKSVTALSLARLNPEPPAVYAGRVQVCGRDVLALSPRALHTLRGRHVAYVFQDPGGSLNPVYTIGFQLRETLRLHQPDGATEAEAVALLQRVGIADPALRLAAYPHALSGGMQQRVMLAMALACRPELLVADEPTTALDVTIQAQVLALLRDIQRERGMALLLITHNLGLVGDVAERVGVMYGGMLVESGPARDVLREPRHPYTWGLRAAVPRLRGGGALTGIPGSVPDATQVAVGCPFAPRCARADEVCASQCPPLQPCDGHTARTVRCFHPIIGREF